MTNFKGRDNEMWLVRFVLSNATSLNQLLLFTSKSDRPEWLKKDDLDISDIIETKISPLQKAWPNAQIILTEAHKIRQICHGVGPPGGKAGGRKR